MRKILLVVWLVSLAALLCLYVYIQLHGSTAGRTSLAEDLGIVCGGTFVAWAVLTWKARQG
jgi:hypothetical protein